MENQKNKDLNPIERYVLLFSFVVFSTIILHSNLRTFYLIPFFGTGILLFLKYKKGEFTIDFWRNALPDLYKFLFLTTVSAFLFFFYFIGFDGIPNITNNDLYFYSALGDHLAQSRTELQILSPIPNANNHKFFYPFYHFTEIWISGVLANHFETSSLWFLLLFTYPLFLGFSMLLLFHVLIIHINPKLHFTKFIFILLLFLFIALSFSLTFKLFKPVPIILQPTLFSYYAWFKTGSLKLLAALPIAVLIIHLIFEDNYTFNKLCLVFCIAFLYPIIIPVSLSILVFMLIINSNKNKIKRLFYFIILLSFSFIIVNRISYIPDFIKTFKIFMFRLGLPALLLIVFFKQKTYVSLIIKILKIITIISFVTLFAVFIKDTFTQIEHADFYQLFDNLNFPLAHIISIITLTILLDKTYIKKGLKYILIISIVVLNLVFLYFLQNKNTNLNDDNRKIISLLNDEVGKKRNLYVVSETFDRSNNPYFQNPYMSLKNSTIPWYVRNFKIIYANTLFPERDATDSLYNKISHNNINIIKNKDSIYFYDIGNIVYQ
jgi:hypothetical protein